MIMDKFNETEWQENSVDRIRIFLLVDKTDRCWVNTSLIEPKPSSMEDTDGHLSFTVELKNEGYDNFQKFKFAAASALDTIFVALKFSKDMAASVSAVWSSFLDAKEYMYDIEKKWALDDCSKVALEYPYREGFRRHYYIYSDKKMALYVDFVLKDNDSINQNKIEFLKKRMAYMKKLYKKETAEMKSGIELLENEGLA